MQNIGSLSTIFDSYKQKCVQGDLMVVSPFAHMGGIRSQMTFSERGRGALMKF